VLRIENERPGAYPAENYSGLKEATFDIVDSILNDYNIKYVALSYPDTIGIASTKGLIHSPDDIAGMTLRAGGTYISQAIQIWGAGASTIAIGETATALERGTVDGVYTGWMMIPSFKFYESAKYITFTAMQNTYYGIMINMDKWNMLSDDQKTAMLQAGEEFGVFSEELYEENRQSFYKTMDENGCEYYTMTEEENALFIDSAAVLMDDVSQIVSEKGLTLIDALTGMPR
jgi:TRAP-type C4-dicarboxylate transport system substrate-binding protein